MGKRITVKEKNKELAKQGLQLKNYGLVLRVYPNVKQAEQINKTIGCSRFIYNNYLNTRQKHYRETEKTLSVGKYKKNVLVPMKSKEEHSFLKEVDKFALEVACENVEDAYSRFFTGQNKYPTFKTKKTAKKSYTTKMTNNNIEVIGSSTIKLPKLGKVSVAKVKTKRNKEIIRKIELGQVRILKATLTQRGSKYYVSLTLEEIVPIVKPLERDTLDLSKVVGIDLGLKTFATIHDGSKTYFEEKAKYIKDSEKKLTKLQRRLAKKQEYSQNFIKAKHKVADLQLHIANQRKDFAHKLSTQLANENQVVILETLNIKGMVKNKKLSKAISDAGWYQFITFLKYKLEWQGKHFIQIDRWYASSKLCSACNEKHVALTLSDREWVCSHCGSTHDRDENAAINIRNHGLQTLSLEAVA
jgi:putative transposase